MQVTSPVCDFCALPMRLRRVFPRSWTLPEVRAFECQSCGNAVSIECDVGRLSGEAIERRAPL
jgi:hypothetical protein